MKRGIREMRGNVNASEITSVSTLYVAWPRLSSFFSLTIFCRIIKAANAKRELCCAYFTNDRNSSYYLHINESMRMNIAARCKNCSRQYFFSGLYQISIQNIKSIWQLA